VAGIDAYQATPPYKVANLCAPGHYYLLNNYHPGYNVSGSLNTSTFTVPPQQNLVTIGNELSAHNIGWGYFGECYDNGTPGPNYCGICDPMQYSSPIMTNPALRANTQHGISDFDAEATAGTLPAVSFVKPGDDGHPGYSTLAAFEGFVTHIVDEVQNNAALWKSTAIIVTFDEGGGYYDSGPVHVRLPKRATTSSPSSAELSADRSARSESGPARTRPIARHGGHPWPRKTHVPFRRAHYAAPPEGVRPF
jgi:phospholipase C